MIFVFFFQAEDGIRDHCVTGVQTCALPILPAENHVTSARDLGILARALIREFPEDDSYWHISSIRYGNRVLHNYNSLIDRYPGADGMKTGFICASGYNVVASATRNGRRLIAIVLGAYSGSVRAQKDRKSTRLNSS